MSRTKIIQVGLLVGSILALSITAIYYPSFFYFLIPAILVGSVIWFYRKALKEFLTQRVTTETGDNTPPAELPKNKKAGQASDINYDSAVTRNRMGRFLFFLFSLGAMVFGPGLTINFIMLILPFNFGWTFFPIMYAGAAVGVWAFSFILPNYLVSVPQVQGFVTVDTLRPIASWLLGWTGLIGSGSTDVIYGPGLHFAYPWEDRSKKSNFSLEVFTLEWSEQVPGTDTLLLVTGSYQFNVALPRADAFVGIDEETIRIGGIDIIKARVSKKLADRNGDQAKGEIGDLNDDLNEIFGLKKPNKKKEGEEPKVENEDSVEEDGEAKSALVSNFEQRYGINTAAVTISGIDMPEAVQKTRDAVDEAKQALKGVAVMYGMTVEKLAEKLDNGDIKFIDYNEMLDRFAAKSGNATMNIQAIKLHGLDGPTAAVVKALTGK